jgi:exodeoxyribonuclease VII small subunit
VPDKPSKPSKPAPTSKSVGVEAENLTFEQAVERLEAIIGRIESGEIGLEQSIREYEHGVALLKRCRAILEQAEQRVEELTTPRNAAGAPPSSPGVDDEAPF